MLQWDRGPTSNLFQVPISPADVAMFKNPPSQPPSYPMNCGAVSGQLLRIVSDAESELMTQRRIGTTWGEWINYINTKKPAGVIEYRTAIVFNEFETSRDSIRTIEPLLFPGFATLVSVHRTTRPAGHYFVLAKDAEGRTYILDPQIRHVVQSHQLQAYLELGKLDAHLITIKVNPPRTAHEFRTDFRSGFSVFDNIERKLETRGNMTFRLVRLADVSNDVLREIDKVLATCFESAGGAYSLTTVSQSDRSTRIVVLGSLSMEELSLQNIATNVHFACMITGVTPTHLYISHLCIRREYRGRRIMRDFTRMLVERYRNNTFSLIADKKVYEGLALSDRISVYSRFGFYITPGTWIRIDTLPQEWCKVHSGYVHTNGLPGRTVEYVVVSTSGVAYKVYEHQIIDCDQEYGAPMQTSSAELRVILPPEQCGGNKYGL